MINQRLFDQYGIDTKKDLGIRQSCARPFDTVLIDKQGSCFACECTAWLPQSIGNLQVQSLAQIIGSEKHRMLQASISDRSYRYCNEHRCTYLRSREFFEQAQQEIKNLRLAIDDSCNLRCPSCRNALVYHKDGPEYRRGIRLADRVNEWIATHASPLKVHIGSDGDPFASHVYRHFMEHTPGRDNVKYSILTNGLMFKEFHTRVPHIMSNLSDLGVSIDGATKDTYEKLRLGGKWDKILEALECMAEAKSRNGFVFSLHMVVQQDNFHEIEAMVELAERYGADHLYFNKIEDWNTNLDFKQQKFSDDPVFVQTIKDIKDRYHWRKNKSLIVYTYII